MQQRSRKLHPIAAEAIACLVSEGGALSLPFDRIPWIRSRLLGLFGGDEIEWASRSLVIAASRLDAAGTSDAANALVEIASSASQALWRLVSVRANERQSAVDNPFGRRLGKRALPAAIDQAPIPGAIRASTLQSGPRRA